MSGGQVTVTEENWIDERRGRELAVRIYLPAAGQFRLLLFSPRLGGSHKDYGHFGAHWARHGYASAHIEHPDSGRAAWQSADPITAAAGFPQLITP